jgi:AcrR family transcriptional regulator
MSEPVAVPAESSDRVRKGERTRLRILDAAAQVLARQGYAAATLTEIASVAQMQAGSLYYHFDSKDASEAICQATAALGPGANGHDRLLAAVAAYTANLVADSDFTRANIRCFEEAPLLTRENLAVPLREFATVWVALLEAGQADGSLRSDVEANVVARMTIAALNSCVQWYRPDGVLDVDEVAAMFATSLVDGLSSGFA